jgi:hypothetical protein
MLTLKEFSDKIVKPSVIDAIKSGLLDTVLLSDPHCFEIIIADPDTRKALFERMEANLNVHNHA